MPLLFTLTKTGCSLTRIDVHNLNKRSHTREKHENGDHH